MIIAEQQVTATTVPYSDIPVLIENGWDLVLFNETTQTAIMIKPGSWKLDDNTGKPDATRPKKGDIGAGSEVIAIPDAVPVEL